MNKLEKVALRCARRTGRPLVLILNNVHYFHNDEQGRNMILQLQQRRAICLALIDNIILIVCLVPNLGRPVGL